MYLRVAVSALAIHDTRPVHIMRQLHVRSANRGVSDAREECAHRREGHGASETIAHGSTSNNQKVPERQAIFLGIGGAHEHDHSSEEGHEQPPEQRSRPLLERPLLVSDASNQKRECDFKRKKSDGYFGKRVFADPFGLRGKREEELKQEETARAQPAAPPLSKSRLRSCQPEKRVNQFARATGIAMVALCRA